MTAESIFLCVALFMGQPEAKMPQVSWDNQLHRVVCMSKSQHALACTIGNRVVMPEFASLDSPRWRSILAHEFSHTLGADEIKAQEVERGSCGDAV